MVYHISLFKSAQIIRNLCLSQVGNTDKDLTTLGYFGPLIPKEKIILIDTVVLFS